MASILFALNHNFLDTGLALLYQQYVYNCLMLLVSEFVR